MNQPLDKPDRSDSYTGQARHLIAIDCIIFGFDEGELKLLAIRRQIEPNKGDWSLIGGFINENESLNDATGRIIRKLTGLEHIYVSQLYAHGEVNRDPVARVLSISYYALIKCQTYNQQLISAAGASWFSISSLPQLIFDHPKMVTMALDELRKEGRVKPIGFELLPPKFTLPQLQCLYEAIYQKTLDKRNFRKNILQMGLLERLDEKDKTNSRKGAWYYRFNPERYRQLSSNGFYFSVSV